MKLDFRRLGAFIAAVVVYVLLSPLLGLIGTLVVLGVSSALIVAFTTSGFNKSLYHALKPREHRELLFHFVSPFAAFAGSDMAKVVAFLGGAPHTVATVLGILVFFAIIIWLSYKVFPNKVAPRMP